MWGFPLCLFLATVARKDIESLSQQWLKSVTKVHVIPSREEVPVQNQHPGPILPRNNRNPTAWSPEVYLHLGIDMLSYFPSGHSLLAELWKKESSVIPCTTALCLSPDTSQALLKGKTPKISFWKQDN